MHSISALVNYFLKQVSIIFSIFVVSLTFSTHAEVAHIWNFITSYKMFTLPIQIKGSVD